MDGHFFNTQEKRNALDAARRLFTRATVKKLSDQMYVLRRPIRYSDQVRAMENDYLRMIVFNHRPLMEKTFPEFIKAMEKLWKKRQDFRVWIPHYPKNKKRYDWLFTEVPVSTQDEYYYGLKKSFVGVTPAQKYGNWQSSTVDGLLNGVPYIMYDSDYHMKLNPNADFYSNQALLRQLNIYLDDEDYRNDKVYEGIGPVFESFMLEENTRFFSEKINELYSSHRSMNNDITRT